MNRKTEPKCVILTRVMKKIQPNTTAWLAAGRRQKIMLTK